MKRLWRGHLPSHRCPLSPPRKTRLPIRASGAKNCRSSLLFSGGSTRNPSDSGLKSVLVLSYRSVLIKKKIIEKNKERIWKAVSIHHIDQIIQDIVEHSMELLASERCALDPWQTACVKLSLSTPMKDQVIHYLQTHHCNLDSSCKIKTSL